MTARELEALLGQTLHVKILGWTPLANGRVSLYVQVLELDGEDSTLVVETRLTEEEE